MAEQQTPAGGRHGTSQFPPPAAGQVVEGRSVQVYDREGEKCGKDGSGVIRRFTQNGRSTFWCPKCQK